MRRERLGLVGRNGCGKSTLAKIIAGIENADSGEVITPKNYKIAYLDQHINFSQATVLEESCTTLPEDEKYNSYKAEKILFGLGFSEDDLYSDPNKFSGGYQLRINLTKTILKEPNLLILDEPTNYLDILSLRWLSGFLKSFPGEIILITHDRDFMDNSCTHIAGISYGELKKIPGSTDKYYQLIEESIELHEKTRLAQEKKIQHMQSFVDRFRAQANKASQAQSRIKQINKIKKLDEFQEESTLGFKFNFSPTHAKQFMKIENLSFKFESHDEYLFQDLNFQINQEDKIAIIGKNGKGKSTLLNVICNILKPVTGKTKFHPSVLTAYYQQTNKKDLNQNASIFEEIMSANPLLTISQARSICGAMMFTKDDADKKITVLSGGEQSRVLFGKILANPANILFLDEPSNHLDMESVDHLTNELKRFQGPVVVVTHNERMLREIATKLIIFHQGKVELFNGGYNEFLEKIGWEEKTTNKNIKKTASKTSSQDKPKAKNVSLIKKLEKNILELEENLAKNNKEIVNLSSQGINSVELVNLSKANKKIEKQIESEYHKLSQLL